ncbi:MAG: hypothetical protein ACOX7P_07190 [Oscillospiraceae bacterium]|jgi:hypothetical protein
MPDDFGIYGKGLNGYVHYTQAVNDSRKGGGGGKPPSGCGCLTLAASAFALIAIIIAAFLA